MKAHLEQIGDLKFRAQAEGSPAIVLHAPEGDEPHEAPSPVQACLLSAMACTAADIVSILKKGRTPVTALEIDADAERAETHPRVFTKIHLHYRVHGKGIKEPAVVRAIQLSTEKYCTVGVMLRRAGVAWENTHEIVEET
jgi:putative redox protein